MKETFDKGIWFLVLIPGFISVGFARLLSDLGAFSEFELVIFCFALAGVNSLIAGTAYHIVLRIIRRRVPLDELPRRPAFIAILTGVSLSVGLLIVIAHESDLVTNTARFVVRDPGSLPQISYHSPLELLLRRAESDVAGEFPDGRSPNKNIQKKALGITLIAGQERVVGYRKWWSTGGATSQLFLSPVCFERTDAKYCRLPGPGVWIPIKQIQRIDFLDAEHAECLEEQLPPVDDPPEYSFPPCIDLY